MTYISKVTILLPLFMFFCLIFLVGCGETIDARQLKEINRLIYKLNENEPFTGTVVNYGQKDLYNNYKNWSCEVHFKNGELHGAYKCVSVETGVKTNEKNYEHNLKTGLETIWNKEGHLISKSEWVGDRLNGIQELFHPETGKLLQQTDWLNNKRVSEKKWSVDGEVLLESFSWSNDKVTGFSRTGALEVELKDGKLQGYKRYYSGNVNEIMSAEDMLRRIGAGAYSVSLFQSAHLDWEELYDNGTMISQRIFRQEVPVTQSNEGNNTEIPSPAVIEPNANLD